MGSYIKGHCFAKFKVIIISVSKHTCPLSGNLNPNLLISHVLPFFSNANLNGSIYNRPHLANL